MCGHVGVISLSTTARSSLSTFIKEAVTVGVLRGGDSIGIGQVKADRTQVDVHKTLASTSKLLSSVAGAAMVKEAASAYVTMVHHRAATVGAVTEAAAQPFHYVYGPEKARKNILVAHNGTLYDYALATEDGTFVSDSEWLTYHLASSELDPVTGRLAVEKQLSKVHGAYSVVVATETHVYFANNGTRSMYVAVSSDKQVLFYASEPGMLDWLLTRNNIPTTGGIIKLDEYKCYTVPLTLKTISVTATSIEPPKQAAGKRDRGSDDSAGAVYGEYYTSSDLDGWYERVTKHKPVYVPTSNKREQYVTDTRTSAALVRTTPVSNAGTSAGVSNAEAKLATRAAAFMRGKAMECMFDEYDCNIREAYGIGWTVPKGDLKDDLVLREFIDSCGVVVRGLPEAECNYSSLYSGTVIGFRWVPEVVKGVMKVRPYFVIDPLSMRATCSVQG